MSKSILLNGSYCSILLVQYTIYFKKFMENVCELSIAFSHECFEVPGESVSRYTTCLGQGRRNAV